MEILLQGQLAVTSGLSSIAHELTESTSVEALVHQLADQLPEEAKSLLVNNEGSVRKSLFVAIDGEHLRDYSTVISTDAKELMLMPPMAGG
jgi:molybdopterin converting factor small subunit